MMEAACTSEMSVNNYFTRQYIPQDKSELHTHRCENLKSHIVKSGSDLGSVAGFGINYVRFLVAFVRMDEGMSES
jgi:hypothetical protein